MNAFWYLFNQFALSLFHLVAVFSLYMQFYLHSNVMLYGFVRQINAL